MKNSGVLPDTCAWIEYFRSKDSDMKQELHNLLMNNHVFACGPVLYELAQGLRSEKEKAVIYGAMSSLPYIEMTEALWRDAGELSATLRRQGKTIPYSDFLIASLAMKYNLSILTLDRHFEEIDGVQLYPL